MKTIKWLCFAALLALGFKLYGLTTSDYTSSDMESFVGMLMAFGLLTAIWVILWVFGRIKSAVSKNA